MDKRQVIHAYQKGMISLHECAQILGIDSMKVMSVINERQTLQPSRSLPEQPMNS